MSIRDLINFVQNELQEPTELPNTPIQPNTLSDAVPDEFIGQLPEDFSPVDRIRRPDWTHGPSIRIDAGTELTLDGQLPGPHTPGVIDTLAHYLPFHFYRSDWGIYLRASGIVSIASLIERTGSISAKDALDLGREILLQHEHFHFLTELACARAEVASAERLYSDYFRDGVATSLEEGLANARSFQLSLRAQSTLVRTTIEHWMLSQGPGYRDFKYWLKGRAFDRGCRAATCCMLRPVTPRRGTEPSEFLYDGLGRARAPVFFVADAPQIQIVKAFPKFNGVRITVHTRDHPPPHLHLEIPPGTCVTRLEWPTLQPVKGDLDLSGANRRLLDSYITRFGDEIRRKIHAVYGSAF